MVVLCINKGGYEFKEYISNSTVSVFVFSCIIFMLLFTYREPFFLSWDEFSHWGVFLKNIKLTNQLHIFSDLEFVHPAYPQAMSVWYYIGSFFNRNYSESQVLLTYSFFLHSCVSVLFPNVNIKSVKRGGIYFLILCLAPFVCLLFPYASYAAPYVTAYLDVIQGVYFGACMIYILEANLQKIRDSFFVSFILFDLLQIKDIAITFYLICIATYFIETIVHTNCIETIGKKIALYINCFICGIIFPFVGKLGWNYLLEITESNIDQFDNLNLSNVVSKITDQISGISDYALRIAKAYIAGFVKVDAMWTGIPIWISALLLLVTGIVLGVLYRKEGKKYVILYSLLAVGYLICYIVVLYIIYLCGMTEQEALSNASMDRYFGCYLGGWSFILYGITIKYLYNNSKKIAKGILYVSILFVLISFSYSNISYLQTTKEEAGFKWYERHAEIIKSNIDDDSNIWLQADNDNYLVKYIMSYDMFPTTIAKNLNMDFSEYNIDEIISIMSEQNIEYIYVMLGKEEFMLRNSSRVNVLRDEMDQSMILRLNGDLLEQIY